MFHRLKRFGGNTLSNVAAAWLAPIVGAFVVALAGGLWAILQSPTAPIAVTLVLLIFGGLLFSYKQLVDLRRGRPATRSGNLQATASSGQRLLDPIRHGLLLSDAQYIELTNIWKPDPSFSVELVVRNVSSYPIAITGVSGHARIDSFDCLESPMLLTDEGGMPMSVAPGQSTRVLRVRQRITTEMAAMIRAKESVGMVELELAQVSWAGHYIGGHLRECPIERKTIIVPVERHKGAKAKENKEFVVDVHSQT